jgi:ferredoxin-NADP reductase
MTESESPFTARLVQSSLIASRTLFVILELSGSGFSFHPGQSITLSFADEPPSDRTRIFSLCTAPFELPRIGIATRLGSGSEFKKHLEQAGPGMEFHVDLPFGDFLLPESSEAPSSFVFLAGGIGITPFRSMIRDHLHSTNSERFFLVTINRNEGETPFLPECRELSLTENVSWHPVYTQEKNGAAQNSPGSAETRERHERIVSTLEQILEKTGPMPLFYIAGPPALVDSLEQILLGQFLVPSERIRTDLFFGYGSR